MHHIQLSDQLYTEAQRAATISGFKSVDAFIAEIIQHHLHDDLVDDYDRLFTPEILAAIDQGAASAKEGKSFTLEQTKAHFAAKREAWQKEQEN